MTCSFVLIFFLFSAFNFIGRNWLNVDCIAYRSLYACGSGILIWGPWIDFRRFVQNFVCVFYWEEGPVFSDFQRHFMWPNNSYSVTTALGKLKVVQIKPDLHELFYFQMFLHLLNKYLSICSGDCFKCWRYSGEQDRKDPCSHNLTLLTQNPQQAVMISSFR